MDKQNTTLVSPNFIRQHTPEDVWLAAVADREPDFQETPKPKSRARRLRRMQSQNFVQRAVYNVVELFRRDKEVA